ncbi:TonB-dependent receptor [Termitidicoccus mucosus]|uniref:TonB-dependent receptor plug domain-containing protein n=1 Tax=Termitidicoccus mucosus TaxID=1184151 RepID=A0A178IAZ0_9BACT|nr:hypothetical protein AW736_25895 [Opitutaceae bacterium TSB47]
MKTHHLRQSLLCALALAMPAASAALRAQQAPSSPASGPDDPAASDDIVRLSVFEVTSAKDSPYVADKSVATTGFAADLAKIPLSINVVTEQFLLDTGGVGFNGIIEYQAGVSADLGTLDNGSRTIANTTVNAEAPLMRMRGQEINVNQRNGLPLVAGFSTENANRVEIARGPMSVFIGGSTTGGVLNLVTHKPLFKWQHTVTASIDSNDSFTAKIDSTGPLVPRKLAYRLIAQYSDDNTWRDYSDGTLKFVNPQLLWRPFSKLSVRGEYVFRERKGNAVGYAQMATRQYQNDFDNPSQALLDTGINRPLGRAYTVEEYRARIGRDWTAWRTDNVDAYGKWVSLGDGEWFTPGSWKSGTKANHFGPHSPYTANYDIFETEANLMATDWLEVRFVGRWANTKADSFMFASPLRQNPDGSVSLAAFNNSNRREEEALNGKIETVFTKELLGINHHLLLGGEKNRNEAWNVAGGWISAATGFAGLSVAGSPNVFNSPATLTGANILNYFDPAVHDYPDFTLLQRYKTDVTPAGTYSQDYTRRYTDAVYFGYSGSFWKDRITLFTGYRNNTSKSTSWQLDRDRDVVRLSTTNPKTSTQSWTFGIVIEPFPGLNIYASKNVGNDGTAGQYLINNYAGGTNPVTQEEREANRAPEIEGHGEEVGVKMEFFNRKLIGRLGYFSVFKKNTVVIDGTKTENDPRNQGTWVDPLRPPGSENVTPNVQWNTTLDGNKAEGFELGLTWQPVRNYSLSLEASHLIKNEITLAKPIFNTTTDAYLKTTAYGEWFIRNGRPLPNTPDDTLKIWQKYQFTDGAMKSLWFGLGIKAQSNFMPNSTTASWGTVVPGYTVLDAAAGYTIRPFNKPVSLQLNVYNLTDKLYSSGGRSYSPPLTVMFQAALSL